MKQTKKVLAGLLVISCMANSAFAVRAASSNREAWNNAASSPAIGTELENGSIVYPNVYADAAKWETWKATWDSIRTDFEKIALTPGKNESELNFGWYSKIAETPKVRFVDGDGKELKVYSGTQGKDPMILSEEDGAQETVLYANKVTADGLQLNQTYRYQYWVDGAWSETYTYQTHAVDKFSVLYVGDPQIGASTGQQATEENVFRNAKEYFARNDAYNWNETLRKATEKNSNISFILSAGDQINQTNVEAAKDNFQQQVEYAGFLYPDALRKLPIATTIGNHDSKSVNYQNHFNNPNVYTEEVGASTAGNDYYFTYGDVLFVVINTNNYNCQTHKDLITKAIAENKNARWKVLMFHQDIYGSGYDHSDSDGMILRTQLTNIIDEAGFDAVLQGHDHTYSRTYQISASEGSFQAYQAVPKEDGEKAKYQEENAACYNILTKEEKGNKVLNPKGTVYFEANSSTGSKFYQLIGTQQDYIAARNQSWRPTYSVIDFDEVSMTVRTYDAATNKELVADNNVETAYTIVKSVDKTNLQDVLAEAEAELEKKDVYTSESLENLRNVMEEAKKIYEKADASSMDAASAYTSVKDAINALVKIETTKPSESPVPSEAAAGGNATQPTETTAGGNSVQSAQPAETTADNQSINAKKVSGVKTGDTSAILLHTVLVCLSAASLAILGLHKKKGSIKHSDTL